MTTPAARAATVLYRRQNAQLTAGVIRDLTRLWPLIDWQRLGDTYPAYAAAASTLIQLNRTRAATLAAGYLNAHQIASGVDKLVDARLVLDAPSKQLATSLLVTGPVAFKTSIRSGATIEKAAKNALVMSTGSVSRLVLAAGRQTIVDTIASNPHTRGWQRVTSGNCCDFCAILADRGAVYSAATVDFAAHDHCQCSAEPVYDGDSRPVRDYVPSKRTITDTDRQRLRDWITANNGDLVAA